MKFEKGKSGNPAGKKPGTGKHQQFRKILEAKAPELIDKAISMALDGDVKMMQMCLDRVLPALRQVDTPISVPKLESANTLLDKASICFFWTVSTSMARKDRAHGFAG